MSQLCKLSQLCYHFLLRFENENYFFLYPQLSPAHRGPEFIDQSIFPKKLTILYIFNKKKLKRRQRSRDPSLLFSFAYFFLLKIYRILVFFGKMILSLISLAFSIYTVKYIPCLKVIWYSLHSIFHFFQNDILLRTFALNKINITIPSHYNLHQ